MVRVEEQSPIRVAYERRNRDLDPQLVWRGKDAQDESDLVVNAPPLYIQEKVHPKALIADLIRQSKENREPAEHQIDMFADFNGLPEGVDRTEFYQHDGYWSEPHGTGRQPPGDGVPGGAGGPAGQGTVHLHRPAIRHPVQLQLSVVNHQPGRAGRQRAST